MHQIQYTQNRCYCHFMLLGHVGHSVSKSRWECLTVSSTLQKSNTFKWRLKLPCKVLLSLFLPCCSTFKYMTSSCCSNFQRVSEILTLPQLHLYRSATRWSCMLWGLFHMRYMCRSSISYMLPAACCGCIGSSKSQYLQIFRQDQIVMNWAGNNR